VAIFRIRAPCVDALLAEWIVLTTEVSKWSLAALELLISHYPLKIGVDDVTWLVLLADSPNLSFYGEYIHHIIRERLHSLHHTCVS